MFTPSFLQKPNKNKKKKKKKLSTNPGILTPSSMTVLLQANIIYTKALISFNKVNVSVLDKILK